MNTFRTLSIILLISIGLIACNNDASVATSAPVASAIQNINSGMTEEAVTAQLGEATLSQSRTLDDLTFTQSEWATETGTISVQFINGKVQFSQFTAVE